MSDYQSEQKRRKKIRARKRSRGRQIVLSVCILVLTALTVSFGNRIYTNYVVMEKRLQQATVERQQKLERIKELEQKKIDLNDPEYVKEIARKNLYYMDKNEVHIKITPNPSQESDDE